MTRAEVQSRLQSSDVVVITEGLGAEQLRKAFPGTRVFFLLPPNPVVLAARMRARGDSPEAIQKRLSSIDQEMGWLGVADYLIAPGTPEQVFEDVARHFGPRQKHLSDAVYQACLVRSKQIQQGIEV